MNKIKTRSENAVVYSTDPEWKQETTEEPSITQAHPIRPLLRISLDRKRRAGKQVTLIEGIPAHELNDLCRKLKSKCATGGTVKDGSIEIQGDHRKKAAAELESTGYKIKFAGG